jgi:hypothetical protein
MTLAGPDGRDPGRRPAFNAAVLVTDRPRLGDRRCRGTAGQSHRSFHGATTASVGSSDLRVGTLPRSARHLARTRMLRAEAPPGRLNCTRCIDSTPLRVDSARPCTPVLPGPRCTRAPSQSFGCRWPPSAIAMALPASCGNRNVHVRCRQPSNQRMQPLRGAGGPPAAADRRRPARPHRPPGPPRSTGNVLALMLLHEPTRRAR